MIISIDTIARMNPIKDSRAFIADIPNHSAAFRPVIRIAVDAHHARNKAPAESHSGAVACIRTTIAIEEGPAINGTASGTSRNFPSRWLSPITGEPKIILIAIRKRYLQQSQQHISA